jgi:hypothetical protein
MPFDRPRRREFLTLIGSGAGEKRVNVLEFRTKMEVVPE